MIVAALGAGGGIGDFSSLARPPRLLEAMADGELSWRLEAAWREAESPSPRPPIPALASGREPHPNLAGRKSMGEACNHV